MYTVCYAKVISVAQTGLAWTAEVTLDRTHRPRLLAARSEELYTDNPARAMREEHEGVEPEVLARFAADAATVRRLSHQQIEARKAMMRLEHRLAVALAEARARGLDVSLTEQSVRKRIEALERKIRRDAA